MPTMKKNVGTETVPACCYDDGFWQSVSDSESHKRKSSSTNCTPRENARSRV